MSAEPWRQALVPEARVAGTADVEVELETQRVILSKGLTMSWVTTTIIETGLIFLMLIFVEDATYGLSTLSPITVGRRNQQWPMLI